LDKINVTLLHYFFYFYESIYFPVITYLFTC